MLIFKKSDSKEISGFFVGNQMRFSDTVIRLVETEMPCLGFTRVASLNEPLFMEESQAHSVRIIIVDDSLVKDLLKTLPQLIAKFPQANIVLAYQKPEVARNLIRIDGGQFASKLVGFLPMNLQIDSWLSVLQLLVCGEKYVPAELFVTEVETLSGEGEVNSETEIKAADSKAGENVPEDDVHLTERELQVLHCAAEGKQNKIIADELNLSQHTVKLHMHHVIAKLGLHNRTEAAIWYLGQRAQT
ncbi:response regulator transcription factor [Lentibacter sp. XHP0401]|uniref:response regulator transcription factor n=1 Tax=Lentibacter sp. XHP0401 TaxID=2984334 RepID=UPI0021E7EC74|nr:response regulator transcription factor [Lentibacter sp. XHP0401]MCV2893427.1 response regulator transcription factor [Lentibacter sp. XHP0401]